MLVGVAVSSPRMFVGCLTAELSNSIFLWDGKFSKRLTVSSREDGSGRTACGCNLLFSLLEESWLQFSQKPYTL